MIISREVIDIQSQGPGSNPTDDSLPKYLFKNQVNISRYYIPAWKRVSEPHSERVQKSIMTFKNFGKKFSSNYHHRRWLPSAFYLLQFFRKNAFHTFDDKHKLKCALVSCLTVTIFPPKFEKMKNQCEPIGLFLKDLGDKFSYKIGFS